MIAFDKPDLLTVIEREGIVELKRRGHDFWAPCPFHQEKTPSFKVSVDRQRWYCFGCGQRGDAVDFVMKLHGLSFKDACKFLNIIPGKPAPIDPIFQRKKKIQRKYESLITSVYDFLCEQSRNLYQLRLKIKKNPAITDAGAILFAELMATLARIDHKLDILIDGDFEDQVKILEEISQ